MIGCDCRKMYWSEWGRVPRIVRADLNGENRREILNSGLRWPNGLAIDVARQRLYVADGRHARILQIDLQGSYSNVKFNPFPSAMHTWPN